MGIINDLKMEFSPIRFRNIVRDSHFSVESLALNTEFGRSLFVRVYVLLRI